MKQMLSLRLRSLFLLLATTFGLMGKVHAQSPLRIDTQVESVRLEGQLWMWIQPGLEGQLKDAQDAWQAGRFQRLESNDVKAGFRPTDTVWVRLDLQPDAKTPPEWILAIPADLPDELALFIRHGESQVEQRVAGRGHPFAAREVAWRGLAFQLLLPPAINTELFLRARSRGSLHFSASLRRPWAFQQWHTREDLGYGVLFGVLSIVGMLGLTRALRYRSITDLLYAGYVLTATLVIGVMAGYTKQLGLIETALMHRVASNMGFMVTVICLCWFSVLLIEWPARDRRRALLLTSALTLLGLGIPTATLLWVPLHFPLVSNQAAIVTVGVLLVMVGDATRRNLAGARRLALAFSPMVFIAGVGLLSTRGLIGSPIVPTYYSMNVAALFHCLMILSVLLNRDAHLRVLHEQQLVHERSMLEVRVTERTQALARRESELRSVLQNAPIPMTVIRRADAQVAYVNVHAAKLYGRSVEMLTGYPVKDCFFNPEDRPMLLERYQAQGFVSEYEVQLKNAQGGMLWVAISMVPIQFEEVPADLVSLVDITERKAREVALQQLANLDALTGAWNRRYLETFLAQCGCTASDNTTTYSILVFDVDHFKRINDTFGHAVGDQVLRRLVEVARSALRATDLLARWGGEEFVLHCPGMPISPAQALAERLRERVQSASFAPAGQVTISIGCAESLPGEAWNDCFIRADGALYRAKASGRNQVQLASASRVTPADASDSIESA